MRVKSTRRGGFTLVELLVVIGILLVLIGLVLLVANSGLVGNIRSSSGSDRIQGWLMQARTRAQRIDSPCGIRFIVDPTTGICTEAQLIEVPDPYTMPAGNQLMIEHVAGGAKRAFVVGPNVSDVLANVTAGDTLSIPATGTIHRINGFANTTVNIGSGTQPALEIGVVNPALLPDLGAAALATATSQPTPTYATTSFGFIRQARPTFGEPSLEVPDTVSILVNTTPGNDSFPTASSLSVLPNVNGFYDIVFSPDGEVQNTGGQGRLILWTANPEALQEFGLSPLAGGPRTGGDLRTSYERAGEMRLVVVYTKTGAVAVQPVTMPPGAGFPPGNGPYDSTKDGIASGL